MKFRLRALLVGAILAAAAAACGRGAVEPSSSPTGPSGLDASPAPALSATPAEDLSGFDRGFAAAVQAVAQVPLAGVTDAGTVTPTCRAIGEPASPARICLAAFPAADPVVTITANATGSLGATGMMMAAASMPDGIKGTTLPAPALGDAANLSRTWGDRGCSAVLAVRDGTLVVSVQVRLATGVATSDCATDAPGDYLENAARALLDQLGAFRAVGLPVDDLAARDRVVKQIVDGTLQPGERDLVTLPPEFASLSDTGEVVAMHDRGEWTIVFFEARGVVDHYSGWVYRSSGKLGADEDPLGGGDATVERIDDHWFHVIAG